MELHADGGQKVLLQKAHVAWLRTPQSARAKGPFAPKTVDEAIQGWITADRMTALGHLQDGRIAVAMAETARHALVVATLIEFAATQHNCNTPQDFFARWPSIPVSAVESSVQCDLLRDIFGNPFRAVAFDPTWRTEHTVGLAVRMYEDRDFAAMPILADALEEAGCDSETILTHCREPGIHVRGCWVVDLLLGKS